MSQKMHIQNENKRLKEELDLYVKLLKEANLRFEEKVNELSLLKRIGDIIRYTFNLELFCKKLTDILLEETNAENCSLMLKDPDSDKLVLKVAKGREDESSNYFEKLKDSNIFFSIGEGIAGKVALEGKPILINDVRSDKRFDHSRKTNFPISSLLCCPFISQQQVLGIINLSNSQPYAFNDNDVRVMSIFSDFATSIFNSSISYKKVKESEEKFRTIFEGSRDAILIIDPISRKIIDCNKQTKDWLGYSKKELLHMNHILEILSRDHDKWTIQHVNKVIKKARKEIVDEIPFLRKDGNIRIGETKITTIRYQGRSLILLCIRDITEREEMEEKLFQTEKFSALGKLSGGIAHDFNNILAAILGRVQLLNRSLGDIPTKEWSGSMANLKRGLEIIEKATLDGKEILHRLQGFYRVRRDDKNFSQINLNKVVNHALEFTRVKWKDEAELKGIKYKIQKELSPLPYISGCSTELREVMINLINNALDAMPKGGKIKIETLMEDSYIKIMLQDNGIGISEAIKNKIFDPFFTTKGHQSSGLGLSVSYGIIKRHKGEIIVNSMEGQGTTFAIKIPLLKKEEKQKEKKKKEKREKSKTKSIESKNANILVIEDEDEVRSVLFDILTSHGHKVLTASQGNKGIELFKKNNFDMVLTDLGMPGISGWQVAREVKRINPRVPVGIITGWQIQMEESMVKERGVDIIVNKPFRIEQVLKLVQEGLKTKARIEAI